MFYSILYGIGIGLCYFTPLACGWEWIPNRKGMVTGFILGAFGFGALITSLFAQAIVNPGNLRPDVLFDGRIMYSADIAANVPRLFYVNAIYFSVLGIIAILLLKRNPEFSEHKNDFIAD